MSVDTMTRAMTKTGWVAYDQLSNGDKIMSFDPKRKKLCWATVNQVIIDRDFSGDLIKVANRNRCVLTTRDYKCNVRNFTTKKYSVVLAEDLQSNHLIWRCGEYRTPSNEVVEDRLVVIAGWLCTDGYVKRCKWRLSNGTVKEYRYGKVTQSKPDSVEILKTIFDIWHVDKYNSDHDKFVANYTKHVFTVDGDEFLTLQKLGINGNKLTWDFIKRLSTRQLKLLYDTMMLGDGTGQKRFSGQEDEVFMMTLIQTLLGLPTTFYQQEKRCWRTRWITRGKGISCWGHHNNLRVIDYSGPVWSPAVKPGFWLAEREGLVFITGDKSRQYASPSDSF